MSEATNVSKPRKSGKWLKLLAWTLGTLVVLVVALYFVVTSGAFVKGVVLPRVGAALNADVSVSDVELSPFSRLVLRDLKVTPKGAEPLFSAAEVSARYSLISILRGTIAVDELAVKAPAITLVVNADGASNLDPLTKNQGAAGKPAGAPAQPAPSAGKPSAPPVLAIKTISISDGAFHQTKNLKGGGRQSVELTGINLSIANIANANSGKLDLAASLAIHNASSASAPATSLEAKLNGAFQFDLTKDLKPASVKGNAAFVVGNAAGNFADLSGFAAKLDCDATATEIKEVALRFSKADAPLGQLRVNGPFDAAKTEGRLNVALLGLDKHVLNIIGAANGIDFGGTTINSTNIIELANGALVINASGQLDAARLQITRLGQTTPTLDFHCGYDVSVNRSAQSALLKTLDLTGVQNQKPLLEATLDKPMTVGWGASSNAVGDATLNLALTGLNLADWRAFAADVNPRGSANAKLKLISQQGGARLIFDFDSQVTGLSAKFGSNAISGMDVHVIAQGSGTNLTQFALSQFQVGLSQRGQPALDLSVSGTLDRKTQGADLQMDLKTALPRLLAVLPQPDVKLTSGDLELSGRIGNTPRQGGARLTFDLDSKITGLSAKLGSNAVSGMDLHVIAQGSGTNLTQFALSHFQVGLSQRGQSALDLSVSGTLDRKTQGADLQMDLKTALPQLLAILPQPDVNLTSGDLELTGRVASAPQSLSLSGQLALKELTGRCGKYAFDHFNSSISLDAAKQAGHVEIRKATGDIRQGTNPGGKFDVSGNFDSTTKSGKFNLALAGFNEWGLRPFVEAALGNKKLVSISINGSASGSFEANGNAAVKADIQATNLVVSDPTGGFPATPLEARAQVDGSVAGKVAQIGVCQVTLTPTSRAKNELRLSGKVDFSQTNAITGNLKLGADSLDVTQYYDLFAGKAKGEQAKAGAAPQKPPAGGGTSNASAAAGPEKEPDAIILPFKNFEAGVDIGRLYLGTVEMTNLQTTVRITGGHIVVHPFQLALNGAPVKADVDADLGVPGFKYDLSFSAAKVPMAPLVNTFQPERAGQIGGFLTADAQIKGLGVTGAGLQKNLTGQFSVLSTNLNLSIANVRSPILNTIINVVVGIPDLLRNPTAILGDLLSPITGAKSKSSGWADQLTAAPIDVISARGSAGDGKIVLADSVVRSAAFQAGAKGTITLEKVLTNSTMEIPISVALKRSLADQVGLVPRGTATNAAYAPLPQFLKMKGKIAKPDCDINKLALVEVAAKSGAGVLNHVGGAAGGTAGSVINALGGLLGGGNPPPQSPQTNQPAQPQQRRGLLDILAPPK